MKRRELVNLTGKSSEDDVPFYIHECVQLFLHPNIHPILNKFEDV